jgi:hypothetical protein
MRKGSREMAGEERERENPDGTTPLQWLSYYSAHNRTMPMLQQAREKERDIRLEESWSP